MMQPKERLTHAQLSFPFSSVVSLRLVTVPISPAIEQSSRLPSGAPDKAVQAEPFGSVEGTNGTKQG